MIDTSTTAGKIKVQQAWVDGKYIIREVRDGGKFFTLSNGVEPVWSWDLNRYFIKPQTILEAASNYSSSFAGGRAVIQQTFIAAVKWRDENPKELGDE